MIDAPLDFVAGTLAYECGSGCTPPHVVRISGRPSYYEWRMAFAELMGMIVIVAYWDRRAKTIWNVGA